MRIHCSFLLNGVYYIIGKIFKSNTVMKNLKLFDVLVVSLLVGIVVWQKIKILVIFEGESMILLVGT